MDKQFLARLRVVSGALLLSLVVMSPVIGNLTNHQENTAYAAPSNVDPSCPSLEWARANLHSDVVLKGESRCAYHMARNDGSYSATVTYRSGWIVDAAEPDEHVYVQIGDDSQHLVKAATWYQCEPNGTSCSQQALDIACVGMHEFARLPQNNFDQVVVCRGSSVGSTGPAPDILAGVPDPGQQVKTSPTSGPAAEILNNGTFNGVALTHIDGGWKYVGPTYTGPAPCKVYYGEPAKWYNPGDQIQASVMSIYGCN
jgi:hypothetical protein